VLKPTPAPDPSNPSMAALPEDPDRPLVDRARRGDALAFGTLVERHQARVRGLALRIAGAPEEADEIAQDAFVRAWQALPAFRGESKFSTWIHRITTRVALDRRETVRRRAGREVGVEDEILAALPGAVVAGAADGGDDRMTARARVALLAELSEAQRTAITLHYFEDLSVIEVAQAMNVPENTVKTHLARGRTVMREAYRRAEARTTGATG